MLKSCLICNSPISLSSHSAYCSRSCLGIDRQCKLNKITRLAPLKTNITWNNQIAYLLGIITSDGCLYSNRPTISISSNDYDYLLSLRSLICDQLIGVKLKIHSSYKYQNNKTYINRQYQFSSRPFYNFCYKIGLHSNKHYDLKALDIPNEFFAQFLRGVIDGDGNYNILHREYSSYKINHIHIRIYSGSYQFLLWINTTCSKIFEINLGTIIKERESNNCYILFWSKNSITYKIINAIYTEADYYLARKKIQVFKFINENEEFKKI